MRRVLLASTFVFALLAPLSAHAGFVVEGSVGKGVDIKPDVKATPSNVMVAPGWSLLADMLRLEVGLVAALPDVKGSKFDFGVRPMVVVSPPVLPIYARGILGFSNLTHKESRHIEYGAALGFSFSLLGLGVFAEAGVLPYSINDKFHWNLEGRLGAFYKF
jgi:hypothetical protein